MCPLAGLELMNAEAVRDVEGKYIEQFTQDWLAGKLLTADDVMMRADVYGCKIIPDIPLLAAVVAWDGAPKPIGQLRQMAGAIRSERFNRREFVLAAVLEGELIIIFQANPKADSAFLTELRAICGPSLQSLYIGRSGAGPEHVSNSYVEAKRTRQAAEICRLTNELVHYEELGIYSMLYLIPRGEEWEAVLQRFIDPLLASDRKGGRMIETLQAFFRCNGNMRLTSETLFTHYNTIVYRLEKAKQLLGVDLDDPEVRLQLQLALKMHQMRNVP
jgi:purine catabolism regulator